MFSRASESCSDSSHLRFDVLGVPVDATTTTQVVAAIGEWIERECQSYVCVTGAHGVIESTQNAEVAAAHEAAEMVVPDGRPLVWCGKFLGLAIDQVRGTDLMTEVLRKSERAGWRHYLYGSSEQKLRALSSRLSEGYPKAAIVGSFSPPFRALTDHEFEEVCARIDSAKPDIVWVGLSTPKQELFMHAMQTRVRAPVFVGVGAAFDFLGEGRKQAPPVVRALGLEWFWRLCAEPRRLWRRYLKIVPRFMFGIMRRPPFRLHAAA